MEGGENVNYEQLYERTKYFIYKYLLKLCRDSSLAEELTQETFFRAYINLEQLKDPDKAEAWLCQIGKNTYYAWCNTQKKQQPLPKEYVLGVPDTEQAFLQKELSTQAFHCLHQLSEPYKEVFMLRVFGELNLKQISSLFGKSESWARVTFYRAKQELQERMEQYGM